MSEETKKVMNLKDGDRVRIAGSCWIDQITFHIVKWTPDYGHTLEAFNRINGVSNGIVAIAVNPGFSVTANYPGKDKEVARERAIHDSAPLIENGDEIEVEGLRYRAQIIGLRYSDPIHFTQVKD